MTTTTLASLQAERQALQQRQASLGADLAAAEMRFAAAREALADGAGKPAAVSEAQSAIAAIESSLGVVGERIGMIDTRIAPLESAVRRERQYRHLCRLATETAESYRGMLEARALAIQDFNQALVRMTAHDDGYGPRARRTASLLQQLRDAIEKYADGDGHGSVSTLLGSLKAENINTAAFWGALPVGHNPFGRERVLTPLPDIGGPAEVVDDLVARYQVVST